MCTSVGSAPTERALADEFLVCVSQLIVFKGARIAVNGRVNRAQCLLWTRRLIPVRASVLRGPLVKRTYLVGFNGGVTRRFCVIHAPNAVVTSDKARAVKGVLFSCRGERRPIFSLGSAFQDLRSEVAIRAISGSVGVLFLVVVTSTKRDRTIFPSEGFGGPRLQEDRRVQVMVINLCFFCKGYCCVVCQAFLCARYGVFLCYSVA